MSYTFSLSRRSLPVRCLCLLLIVLVLWCFFMVPRAGAVALEATTIAYGGLLVGTILVGAGVVFSSHGDMVKVGNAMYKTLVNGSSAIGKTISSISAWAVEHGASLAKGALRVGKDLYESVVDAFNASYSDGSFKMGDDVAGSSLTQAIVARGQSDFWLYMPFRYDDSGWNMKKYAYYHCYFIPREFGIKCVIERVASGTISSHQFGCNEGAAWPLTAYNWEFDSENGYVQLYRYFVSADDSSQTYGGVTNAFQLPDDWRNVVKFSASPFVDVAVPTPDLKYPSDDYLVKMPDIPSVDTATGDVTYPNDTAYTKDAVAVPYPVDTEGVKVPDIPYDKVVDQSTGKSLDDTGTDTENPSKPGEGTDTGSNTGLLQKILDLLKNFFDSPSDFRLNMDGFRNLAIKDKFPFCIPFDMVDSVKQFAADAADYQFRVKLDTQYFKVDHVVDLTPLAVPLAFFRYLVVAWFAWVLMSRTHDLMKW